MARYIDVDKLIKDVLTSWGKDNHASVAASYVHSQEHRHLMSIIEKQPTANVAPMEEVERLNKEVDRLSQVVLYHEGITQMEVDEAKAHTVKKMRERLYRELAFLCAKDKFNKEYFLTEVDRVAKEMLEETE